MKKVTFIIAVFAAFCSGLIFTSCETAAEKSNKADETVVDAKADLKDAQNVADAAAIKAADAEAWKTFKLEAEVKMNKNDMAIEAHKSEMAKSGKKLDAAHAKLIADLEQRNKDLKARINAYDKGQTDWEAFKREFNHDMDGIGQSLKDLTVNNKK
jgi:acyl-CoA synthetase (AMP-forming)/AMP-acid ligase II